MKNSALYIQMFSLHGLIRSENLEMGRDADTGGQIKYVLELCRTLSELEGIRQVDLFTRWISDKSVSSDYARPVEIVTDKFRIVRIRCGGAKYMRKELLWPHLDEYTDKTIKFMKSEALIPDIVHGHYPDAGAVALELSLIFGIPFIYTGHSMGRVKKEKLLHDGMKESDINKKYRIDQRIQVEEEVLRHADLIITSTRQEITDQYGIYSNAALPIYEVIPPGIGMEKFYPYYHHSLQGNESEGEETLYAIASLTKELNRFFLRPEKPLILTLCRPDKRKNIQGLIKAYGEDRELQTMANLAVFAGIRRDISEMEENERNVLTDMLLLMDKYDLYGKMAIPKKHNFEYEVPELYRIAAEKRGVFVNPALTEPFGLTLLEASATGLPIVATNDGGPRDIMENCQNGLLVDPTDTRAIARAVKNIIANDETWDTYSKNGVMNARAHYTWARHAETYMDRITRLKGTATDLKRAVPKNPIGRRLAGLNYYLITDIDNTLIGADNSRLKDLVEILEENREVIGFGIATGRTVDSAAAFLEKHGVVHPDILICSVGTELYYGRELHRSHGWKAHIAHKWNRERIVGVLKNIDFLEYQEEATQRDFKVSYYMEPGKDRLAIVHDRLLKCKCRYHLIYSAGEFLDILPYRASKGKAIRYLSYKWGIPLMNFLVCGDSGNDEEMLRGEPLAVVVGNYREELEPLKGAKHVYFAKESFAGGIIEGISHYHFIENVRRSRS
jgi:sucrose-phosphate synthase